MTAELVAANPGALDQLPAQQREAAVTLYLSDARDRLALAVEATGPEQVAAMKAEIATVAEATKQLGLSKEIRDDATEMVRRAEYSLGKSIRKGQAEGTVATVEEMRRAAGLARQHLQDQKSLKPSPSRFVDNPKQLTGATAGEPGIYDLSDGVSEDRFEDALTEAREDGNLSRANVARKVKGQQSKLSGDARLAKIAELAEQGMTSRQIGDQLGHHHGYIRQMARDAGIDIPADKTIGRVSQKIDQTNLVQQTVGSLEALVTGLRLLDTEQVDPAQADEWATSLDASLKALNRFRKQIKEMTHV